MLVYTTPPSPEIFYPYIIINASNTDTWYYIKSEVKYLIIDSGVFNIFHKASRVEYPGGYKYWIGRVASLWYYASRYVRDAYATIPDYPSDYPHNPVPQNVEKTIRNIEYALEKYPDIKWLIPIQGLPDSLSSVAKTISILKERGLLKSDYVAIASTCVSRNTEFLKRLALTAKTHLPDKRIHMFGVIKKAWDRLKHLIFSVDTVTHSFYCYGVYGIMCSNSREKAVGWVMFLTGLKKGGYIDDETFELSLESAAKWSGLDRGELLELKGRGKRGKERGVNASASGKNRLGS